MNRRKNRKKSPADLEAALRSLEAARRPLFRELLELRRSGEPTATDPPQLPCQRSHNQMRISTLEALDIARALETVPELRRRLPAILERAETERRRLRDSERRQNYDCPLLEGARCLVHDVAKPIGCLGWNPGRPLSDRTWRALAGRDRLNRDAIGRGWELKAIPLILEKALATFRRRRGSRPETDHERRGRRSSRRRRFRNGPGTGS